MRIFGGILPFIGFRDEDVVPVMRRFLELPPEVKSIPTFQIEWLNRALVIPLVAPIRVEKK